MRIRRRRSIKSKAESCEFEHGRIPEEVVIESTAEARALKKRRMNLKKELL